MLGPATYECAVEFEAGLVPTRQHRLLIKSVHLHKVGIAVDQRNQRQTWMRQHMADFKLVPWVDAYSCPQLCLDILILLGRVARLRIDGASHQISTILVHYREAE